MEHLLEQNSVNLQHNMPFKCKYNKIELLTIYTEAESSCKTDEGLSSVMSLAEGNMHWTVPNTPTAIP